MSNSIWLEFGDGQYLAHLKNKRIDELETKRQKGLGEIYAQTMTGVYRSGDEWIINPTEAKWSNADLIEVVRQAFIGGGKAVVDSADKKIEPFHVNNLIQSYIEDRPRVDLWKLAASILHATMEGYESPGEVVGVETPPPPTPSES